MKKTRVLAASLAVSLMLMGAGYASWTDSLTINNTVSTGELNVKFSDYQLAMGDYVSGDIAVKPVNGKEGKTLDVTLGNLSPGVVNTLNTTIVNDGSIPAVVKGIDYKSNLEIDGKKGLSKMTDEQKAKVTVKGTIQHYAGVNSPIPSDCIKLDTNLKDLGTELAKINWRVEPRSFIKFENIKISLPITVGDGQGNENEMEKTYAKASITLNFGQHNALVKE